MLQTLDRYRHIIKQYRIKRFEQFGTNLRFRAEILLKDDSKLYVRETVIEGKIELIRSIANKYEIDKISEAERKEKIMTYLNLAKRQVDLDKEVEKRAMRLNNIGFIGLDALHIALAEKEKVDYFVTCDDQLLKTAQRHKGKLDIIVLSVFELMEIIYHAEDN